jgi:molybdopterin-binding protein
MNTAKRFNISGIHSECVQGMADAFVRIELGGGTAEVSNITAHYATILVAAKSLGVLVVTVKNIGWAVPLNGKIFSNDNCGWVFANLSQSIVNPNDVINSIRNAFTGTVPSYVSPSVSGVTATSTAQPVTLNLTGGAQTVTFTPVVTTTINTSNAVITPKAIVGYNQFTYLY